MAKVKKKRKPAKAQDGWLENFLRFEIIVVLFSLIGFYYFLSFSPIRMPKETISSPRLSLALLPPPSETVVSVQEEGVFQVADTAFPDSHPEAASQAKSESDYESRPSEVAEVTPTPAVKPGSVKSISSPEKDDKLSLSVEPQKVEAQEAESYKLAKTQSLETVALNSPRSQPPVVPAVVEQVVEVGSYVLQSDLEEARSQLEVLGFTVTDEVRKLPTPMYRVFMGPYSNRQETRKMMAVVRKMGDQPFIQKLEVGSLVIIGSFYLEASVVAWENMYHDAGLNPKVRQESLMIPHTQLLLVGSQVNNNPEVVLTQVRAAGFSDANLKTISSSNPSVK